MRRGKSRDEPLSSRSLLPYSDRDRDQRLIEAAKDIILQGSCAVSKPVRSGFTTSCAYACAHNELAKKLIVFEPTKRILRETLDKASNGSSLRVPGNAECPLIKAEIKANLILAKLPSSLPDCEHCNASAWCEVLEILRADTFEIAGLTYAKLTALMLSKGKMAKSILNKLSVADVVLLDEGHLLSLPSSVSVKAFKTMEIPANYKVLARIYEQWQDFCLSQADNIQVLLQQAEEKGHTGECLAKTVLNADPLPWKDLRKAWAQLRELAINHELPDQNILALNDIISILSNTVINIGYITEEEGESGSVRVSAGEVRQYRALNEFLTRYTSHATLLFVSGTLIEPKPGYFSELAGREVLPVIYPDLREATKKLTLIPDRWRLTSRNFKTKLPLILKTIEAIAEREKQPIYLLAPNGRKASWIRTEIDKLGLNDIFVDYYRSDHSLGVERSERICISIGLAELPSNAYDPLAWGQIDEVRWINSRILRSQAVDTATWQAVNRVRDPEGIQESRVYFIGCRLDQVRRVATWGSDRQLVLDTIRENGNIRTPLFKVQVNQDIELPKIYGEQKGTGHSERRRIQDLIEGIENYNKDIIFSEKNSKVSNNINRHNGVKLGIYNFPSNKTELDLTSSLLYLLFVNRTDCFARQSEKPNPVTAKWDYFKVLGPIDSDKIKQHINGNTTLGTYQISLNDTCKWVCDDIDSHHGESDSREKVGRVVSVLRSYQIPFLLEASGSIDSYHIWIFLAKTKTYNAYQFVRQINAEASVKCEAWPKQKSLDKNNKYGNLVKLPICFNRSAKGRSAFLDPDTFEPLEGPIEPPGLVHLLEIPGFSDTSGMPRIMLTDTSKLQAPNALKYCQSKILADKIQLNNAEGHILRLSIAIQAQAIGMKPEDATRLFQYQDDFDYAYSLNKVLETWSYGYNPYSCAGLKDQCPSLVLPYCSSCPGSESESKQRAKNKYVPVLVLQDVPSFVGIDGRTYGPFRAQDMVSMPPIHADNLVNHGLIKFIQSEVTA